jgi:hypothetical protein
MITILNNMPRGYRGGYKRQAWGTYVSYCLTRQIVEVTRDSHHLDYGYEKSDRKSQVYSLFAGVSDSALIFPATELCTSDHHGKDIVISRSANIQFDVVRT